MDDDASYTTWDLDKIDKEYNRKKRLFFFLYDNLFFIKLFTVFRIHDF